MPGGEPFHQRAAGVQPDLQRRVAAKDLQKRAIAIVEGLLHDAVEVADRLMIVQDQGQCESYVAYSRSGEHRRSQESSVHDVLAIAATWILFA